MRNVLFIAYPQDYEPRPVHGFAGETELLVELRFDETARLAKRADAVRPGNAKRRDVRKILDVAAEYFDELVEMWERMHG